MDKKQTFSLWYVLAALVGMILLQEFVAPRHTQTLTYSEFKQALVAGKLDDVVMADGIAATNDPVLQFRSPAYAVSFGKRLSGQ